MDGHVDVALEQRVLDLLDEESLATDLCEQSVSRLVTGRLDGNHFAGRTAVTLDLRGDGAGLPEGELAAAGAETQWAHDGTELFGDGAAAPEPLAAASLVSTSAGASVRLNSWLNTSE